VVPLAGQSPTGEEVSPSFSLSAEDTTAVKDSAQAATGKAARACRLRAALRVLDKP